MHNNNREKVIAAAKLTILKESVKWKDSFGTPDGKKCLALLKETFYDMDTISHADPVVTQNRAAQRDLVRYIITQVEYKGE